MRTTTAHHIAMQAKAAGISSADEVAIIVDTWEPDLTQAEFDVLRDEVTALIPTVPFDRDMAAGLAMASHHNRLDSRAESIALALE